MKTFWLMNSLMPFFGRITWLIKPTHPSWEPSDTLGMQVQHSVPVVTWMPDSLPSEVTFPDAELLNHTTAQSWCYEF